MWVIHRHKILLLIIALMSMRMGSVYGGEIKFIESVSLDSVRAMAAAQNKHVFIDTYAPWCIPCKHFDKVFKDDQVSEFFNEHFINVRINMDASPYAGEYRTEFGVIFLPTIVMLNEKGIVRFKADRIMSKADLISTAKKCLDPNQYVHSMTTGMESNPLTNSGIETRGPETIIHVLGEDKNNLPYDLLKEEAYFRIQFMDGSHITTAREYLKTQKDWKTPENIRFIHDFVTNVNSPEWNFLMEHRPLFEEVVGKSQVQLTLESVIYTHFKQGYPRPNLQEAKSLLSIIHPDKADVMSYAYVMRRSLDECSTEYIAVTTDYLNTYNPHDHLSMFQLSKATSTLIGDHKMALSYIKNALNLDKNCDYYEQQAIVYAELKQWDKADESLQKAKELATKEKRNLTLYRELENKIIAASR
jgi:tetratricopeptide (TPR) repeat protein